MQSQDVWLGGDIVSAISAVPKPAALLSEANGVGLSADLVREVINSYYGAVAGLGGLEYGNTCFRRGCTGDAEVCDGVCGRSRVGGGVRLVFPRFVEGCGEHAFGFGVGRKSGSCGSAHTVVQGIESVRADPLGSEVGSPGPLEVKATVEVGAVSEESVIGESKAKSDSGNIAGVSGDEKAQTSKSVAGAFGKVEPQVSEKTLANRRRRQEKKEKKKARQAGMKRDDWRKQTVVSVKSELQLSLEAKWKVENELAVERARQELAIVKLRDITKEAKKREVKVMRQTECSKVAVEKAFGTLKATGNVPGFCETVVSTPGMTSGSSPGESISPDSSASMHEFRAVQKKNLDLEAELKECKRLLRLGAYDKLRYGETVAFTADNMSEACFEQIAKMCPNGYDKYDYPEDPDTVYVKAQ